MWCLLAFALPQLRLKRRKWGQIKGFRVFRENGATQAGTGQQTLGMGEALKPLVCRYGMAWFQGLGLALWCELNPSVLRGFPAPIENCVLLLGFLIAKCKFQKLPQKGLSVKSSRISAAQHVLRGEAFKVL